MKAPTTHYKALKMSLAKAKKILVRVPLDECKSDLQHLKLQSYIILCHASFEEYLEKVCHGAALIARKRYLESGIITRSLVALISSKIIYDMKDGDKNNVSFDLVSDIDLFSREALNKYRHAISTNHGIKSENQDRLLIPIGVSPNLICPTLQSNLNVLGTQRGAIAHQAPRIRAEYTRSAVETSISAIMSEMHIYDKAVCAACGIPNLQLNQT